MSGSGTSSTARALNAPATASPRPLGPKDDRGSVSRRASDTFDVRSFLDSARVDGRLVDYRKGQVIFAEGDSARDVLFIEKGLVRLSVTSASGKVAVVTILDAGKFVGVWCLSGQSHRLMTATAMAPTSVRVLPKELMIRLLHESPSFSQHFISYLLARNMAIAQRVVDLFFDSTEKRLIRALLFLAQFGVHGSHGEVILARVSQEALAEMVGSSRTHVNGFMRKLKRFGFVDYSGALKIHRTPLMSLL
jgi:CRP/FNR family cyclic AMP-dependent transcriptional regulator